MRKHLLSMTAVLMAAMLAAPTPARADDDDDARAQFSLGAQATSGNGLLASLKVLGGMGPFELGATLMAPPTNIIGFFTADAHVALVGHTRSFLPIDLMPVMGFGMATNFRDIPSGTSTKLDLNMWMYMPVGLRYQLGVKGFTVGAEALYHLPALYLIAGQTDPARWHYELNATTGPIMGALFYEAGAVYNGPGARVGLAF